MRSARGRAARRGFAGTRGGQRDRRGDDDGRDLGVRDRRAHGAGARRAVTGLIPEGTATLAARPFIPEPERELPQDPVAWVRDDLSEHLWSKQRQIMRSVVEHRYTAVPSCHGPGKSYIGSRIGAWWIRAHPIGEAFVVTSAPTEPQVKAILWRELARAHRNAALPGRITLDAHWYVGPKGA